MRQSSQKDTKRNKSLLYKQGLISLERENEMISNQIVYLLYNTSMLQQCHNFVNKL
jgi:hypothetical protein